MKKNIAVSFQFIFLSIFMAGSALAIKPGEGVSPYKYLSGKHYELKIIGENDDFTCPDQENDDYGDHANGNVIFVSENGEGIQILMQSGKGKKATKNTDLQVIDPCTASFDETSAIIQLPETETGYYVYARAFDNPSDGPTVIFSPDLLAGPDENGTDLIYLGLVYNNGFVNHDGDEFMCKKRKSKVIDITRLLKWSGPVCYFTEPEDDGYELPKELCCKDKNFDGVFESCSKPKIQDGAETCKEDYFLVDAYCKVYKSEWVFNISDLAGHLWSINNNGVKMLRVRFYPIAK